MNGQPFVGFGAPPENPAEFIRKALDSTAASTGNQLIPQEIQPYITETNLLLNPWESLIPRIPWYSGTFDKRLRTGRGRSRFVGDGMSSPVSISTYAGMTEPLKILQSKGQITNFLEFAAQRFTSPLRNEINGASMEFRNEEAWGMIHGNRFADPYSFSGLDYWINTIANNPNVYLANGATITTDMLDAVIDGAINLGIDANEANAASMGFFACTAQMISKISALKQSGQRWNTDNQITVPGGFRFKDYRGFPLVPTSFLKPNQAWPGGTVTTATASTGGFLPQSTTYKYYVSAILLNGESLPCVEASQATGAGTSTNTISLSWSAPVPAGAVRAYRIYRTAAGGATGTEVLYTEIPGCIYTQDALGFGFMTSVDVIKFTDTGVTTSVAYDTATGTVAGSIYTPNFIAANYDELLANEEEIYFCLTRVPLADDGYLTFRPTGVPMQFMPLAPIGDFAWFLLKAYETFIAIPDYQFRISRVKPV